MIRGVIFDLDGVLLDSMSIWNNLGVRYLKKCYLKAEDNLSSILFSMSMEQGAEYLALHYPLQQTQPEVLHGLQEMLKDFYYYEVKAKDGCKELLMFLKQLDIPMIAATSSPREHVTRALKRNGLLDFMQEILTTSEVGESKYSPKIYDLAAEKMQTSAEQTLVFEDSLYALQTAKKAGYVTVGVYDKYGEPNQEDLERMAQYYVKSMSECTESKLQQMIQC